MQKKKGGEEIDVAFRSGDQTTEFFGNAINALGIGMTGMAPPSML